MTQEVKSEAKAAEPVVETKVSTPAAAAVPKPVAKAAAPKVKPVAPVFAEARITYGKASKAVPGDIFVPTSEKERSELLAMKAARDLTEAELALHEKLAASKSESDEDVLG